MKLASLALGISALALSSASHAANVVDGGFEVQGAASNASADAGFYCYFSASDCAAGAWSGTGNSGLQIDTNTAWPGTPTSDGAYYGFVQTTGTLTNSVTLAAGTYDLSLLVAGRPYGCCGGDQTVDVTLNGAPIYSFTTTTGETFGSVTSGSFTTVGGTFDLTFTGTDPLGGDNTAFIDAVSLNPVSGAVPEPASWAMMLAGLGLAGAALRRRKIAVAYG